VSAPGKEIISKAQRAAIIEDAFASLAEEVRIAELVARTRKIHYDAAIAAGFTAEQAMVSCMKRGLE